MSTKNLFDHFIWIAISGIDTHTRSVITGVIGKNNLGIDVELLYSLDQAVNKLGQDLVENMNISIVKWYLIPIL